ncbi:major facilitator superfamily domain-containing protein [Hygrophoropsis aurantiaca]|uniref:Major facilitator superfamily domain-containing protein n=1 Tax=Hygrophoropsis aurantiaca TaxID=72124 RepID=A0ACB8AK13_9AGAM|nr:major facilitator superfamily domain-containing protein [Hygrophoropsis aurantiaca]
MAETLQGSPTPDHMKNVDDLNDDDFSEAEHTVLERTVWRKLDRWVLPICTIFYLLSFLDRSNIANARVAGMQTELKMSNYQYSVALTVTYVPYIAAEFPSNLLLKYIGPDLMLPTMVTLWGLVATLQGVVTTYSGLLACRFFLGLLEGGLFPGLVLYLSFFYPRDRLQIRVATFFAAASLSGAFSGLLAAGIMEMNGAAGKPGWAWIFILEGIFTFIFGSIAFFVLPRSPERARFFSPAERSYVVLKLKQGGAVARNEENDHFSWLEILKACKSPQVLLLAPALFFNGSTLFGLAYFEPTIVAGLGYAGNRAQLMTVPPFAAAFACAMISAFVSDRYRCRGLTSIFFSMLSLIGFSMFYGSDSIHIRYGSLFFSVTGAYCTAPALSTWIANNSAPHVRRATAVAIAFIMSNSGGILATWLLGSLSPAPNYTKATLTFVIMSILMMVFPALNLAYLWRQNRLKAEKKQTMGKEEESTGLGDRSVWFEYSL